MAYLNRIYTLIIGVLFNVVVIITLLDSESKTKKRRRIRIETI